MPRKTRLLTSYPKQFFAFFEAASLRPLNIPTASFKDAQRTVAELNQFRVALRANLDPFYPTAEKIAITSSSEDNGKGEVYMRNQEDEWSLLGNSVLTEEELAKGEKEVEKRREEAEALERTQLNAPAPEPSRNPFDIAMDMLTKKEE